MPPCLSPPSTVSHPEPLLTAKKHSEFSTGFLLEGGGGFGQHEVLSRRQDTGNFGVPSRAQSPEWGQLSWGSGEGSFKPLLQFAVSLRKPVPAGRDRQGVTVFRLPSGAQILPPYPIFPPPPPPARRSMAPISVGLEGDLGWVSQTDQSPLKSEGSTVAQL